jgi:DNA-binding response OmpR family regulator
VKRKLLLADDSVTIQRVVELTFSGEDIDVVTVSDGEQAIARMSADPPDIVLADIAMPKKNGYEVAAFVKEHPTLANVPVLLLAGAFEPVDEERARRVKSDGVLVKPFETHEVIARVRELIDGERRPAAAPAAVAPPPIADAVETVKTDRSGESLDEYFDRLDVAFATRAQTPPRPFPHLTPPAPAPAAFTAPEPEPEPEFEAEPRNPIADLFRVFLEVEQGERDASSVNIPEEIARLRRRNRIE